MLHIAKRVCLNPWAKKLPENGKKPIFLEKKILKKFFYNYLITLELNFLGLSKAA